MDCSSFSKRLIAICILLNWLSGQVNAQDVRVQNPHVQPGQRSAITKDAQELFDIAAAHYSRSAWSMAVDKFNELESRFPGSSQTVESRFYLGESLVEFKQYERAIIAFQAYLAELPDAPQGKVARSSFRIAECHFLLQQDPLAMSAMQNFVFEFPENDLREFALPIIGQLRLERNEPQIAQRAFEMQLQDFPESELQSQVKFGLAQALQNQQQLTDASNYYRQLAETSGFEKIDKSLLELGRISFALKHLTQAKGWLERLIEHYPDSNYLIDAKLLLARIYLAEDNPRVAEQILLEYRPEQVDQANANAILLEQSRIALRRDRTEDALRWTENLAWNSIQPYWIDKATELRISIAESADDWESILKFAENYRAKNVHGEHYYPITLAGGVAAYKTKDYVAAVDLFQILLGKIEQDDFVHFDQLNYWIALCEIGQGEFELALARLNQIDRFNGDTDFEASIALAKAIIFRANSNFLEAVPQLEKYLEQLPQGSDADQAQRDLVVAYSQLDRNSDADQLLERVWDESNENNQPMETAMMVAWRASQSDDLLIASKWYQAVANNVSNREIREQAISGLAFVNSRDFQADESAGLISQLQTEINNGSDSAIQSAIALASSLEQQGKINNAQTVYQLVVDQWVADSNSVNVEYIAPAVLAIARNSKAASDSDRQRITRLLHDLTDQYAEFEARDAALYQLAWCQLKNGGKRDCIESFKSLAQQFPTSEYRADALFRIAKLKLDDGEVESAKIWLNELVAMNDAAEPVAFGLYQLGKIAVRNSDWNEAKSQMQKLVLNHRDSGVAAHGQYWLAESQYQLDELAESLVNFELIGKSESQPANRRVRALLRIAQIHASNKNWNELQLVAEQAEQLFPDNNQKFQFDYLLGRCMMDRARFNEARKYFQLVTNSLAGEESETAAMAQWMIGETFFHQQQFSEAINEYFLVESKYSYPEWQGAALVQAAKCYLRLDQHVPANKLCRHIIATHDDTRFALAAKQILESNLQKNPSSAIPASFSIQQKK